MARPPSGPIGNSPRDVRDDAVGVPAEPVTAPEPPRWPPKRKKITSNTFHAKVSGGTSPGRADRKPTFRRGGMVKSYASGGSVAAKIEKRDKLPGEDKNDPFAKQNLKGAAPKLARGGGVKKKADGGGLSVFPAETPEERGRREGRKIIKQMPFNAKQRSESTERAGATDRLGKDFDSRLKTGKYERTYDEVGDDLDIRTRTGEYKRGGGVKK